VLVDFEGTVCIWAPRQDLVQVERGALDGHCALGGHLAVLRPETALDVPNPDVITDHPAVNLERGAVRVQHDPGHRRFAFGEHTRSFEMYMLQDATFPGQLSCRRERHLDVCGGWDDDATEHMMILDPGQPVVIPLGLPGGQWCVNPLDDRVCLRGLA